MSIFTRSGFHVRWARYSAVAVSMILLGGLIAATAPESRAAEQRGMLETEIQRLKQALPTRAEDFTSTGAQEVARVTRTVHKQAAAEAFRESRAPEDRLATIDRLCRAKRQVDEQLEAVMARRFEIESMPAGEERQQRVRSFLRVSSELIDLSGRLNFELRETVLAAGFAFAPRPELQERLVDRLAAHESTIGASLMTPLLLDPPPNTPNQARPVGPGVKQKVLTLLARTGRSEVLPIVVRFLRGGRVSPELTVIAADAICRIGLPQVPLSEQERLDPFPDGVPGDDASPQAREPTAPAITAGELREILQQIDADRLSPRLRQHRTVLLDWLGHRARHGVGSQGYQVNGVTLKPGDWLLMRNSSPYNLFTDLSPGLFSHVGVVALRRGEDGIERLALVDVTERQVLIPGDNIETRLSRPLYYAVLRHEDPEVGRKMGEVASSLVGNEVEFDLSFETSRVTELRGEPLAGRKIRTYCAGVLLLCAQETDRPRSEFFPLPETIVGDRIGENLSRLGLRVGDDFISPTGPLFARQMQLIHLSDPMYDPEWEIEQRIYDHFADGLADELLTPRQNLFQSLRQQLADASKTNPLLARALARTAGVPADTDLAAAARALAVVETLDEVAYGSSGDYREARRAIMGGEAGGPPGRRRGSEGNEQRNRMLRERHADLVRRSDRERLSPYELTDALVTYYAERGKRQIDEYFFPGTADHKISQ